jgi:dihydrofolate reductase
VLSASEEMMAKLIYAMMMSLDGYIAGPENGHSLLVPNDDLHRHFNEWMKRVSVTLYGRRMYEVMRYWETADERPDAGEVVVDFARAWRATPKIVISTTLREVGPNTRLIGSDVEHAVRSLKADTAGEISVAGAGVAGSLARFRLIDEYRLYFHPVVLGGGKPFFEAGSSLKLEPLGIETLPQGVMMLRYAPAE